MKKLKLFIQGMHCASCSNNVEKSLKKVGGVKNASVSLLTRKGIVEAEDSVTEEELRKAVSKTGYKIISIEKE